MLAGVGRVLSERDPQGADASFRQGENKRVGVVDPGPAGLLAVVPVGSGLIPPSGVAQEGHLVLRRTIDQVIPGRHPLEGQRLLKVEIQVERSGAHRGPKVHSLVSKAAVERQRVGPIVGFVGHSRNGRPLTSNAAGSGEIGESLYVIEVVLGLIEPSDGLEGGARVGR